MADLSKFDVWLTSKGPLRDLYLRWRIRRSKRWAKRHNVPPAPPLDDLLRRIESGETERAAKEKP